MPDVREKVITLRVTSDALTVFAARMARKLPRLERLAMFGEWAPGLFHLGAADIFLYLTTFTSVTYLQLSTAHSLTAITFGRLICALPGLSHLSCRDLAFSARSGLISGSFLMRRKPVTDLELIRSDDVAEFFATSKMAVSLTRISFVGRVSQSLRQMLLASESLQSLILTIPDLGPDVILQDNTNLEALTVNRQYLSEWTNLLFPAAQSLRLSHVHLVCRDPLTLAIS
ncbi:uncharacterized protein FIBRA_07683 [Fibroporia radiculosa]|uniref:F-box domain-containing protein n=1 Tax=Fibroporia radiculosa TaxID=599839 RepID=J4I147_9APHY|nr:uncharacterized protein FIBRA_07683 [Fibroporia radiculosa]CCM05462.1 predicted protein [Fibroporia radiculosa]